MPLPATPRRTAQKSGTAAKPSTGAAWAACAPSYPQGHPQTLGVNPAPAAPVPIGVAARASGASPKALRLYESLGLLGRVQRLGRYRVYNAVQLRRVALVRQALALGVRLADLRLALGSGPAPDWLAMAALVQARATQVQAQLRALRLQHRQLQEIEAALRACDGLDGAPAHGA